MLQEVVPGRLRVKATRGAVRSRPATSRPIPCRPVPSRPIRSRPAATGPVPRGPAAGGVLSAGSGLLRTVPSPGCTATWATLRSTSFSQRSSRPWRATLRRGRGAGASWTRQSASLQVRPLGNPGCRATWATLSHRYLYGPLVDQVLADEQLAPPPGTGRQPEDWAGAVLWALADPQQTIHDAAKYIVSAGAVKVVTRRYLDAYGSGGSWSNFEGSGYDGGLFMYTGRFHDQLTGLAWHLHRWYDPALGRWLSEDPIGLAGDPWNLYRYVGNSLTNAVDPSGLWRFIRRMGSFYVIFNPTAQNVTRAIGIAFKPDAAAFRTRVPLGCKVEARFVQVVKVEVEPRLLEYLLLDHIPGNPRTDVWQLDSKNPPYYPTDNPIFDPYSIVPSWPSMTDEPGIYGFAKANVISFSFDAVTAIVAAKSVGDIRKGDVFGFIRWGYTNRYAGFVGRRAVVSQFTYLNDKTWGPDSFPGFNGLIASTTENWFMDLVLTRWFP